MNSLLHNLSGWTTEQLLDEVVKRNATDAFGLQSLGRTIIRARLANADRRADSGMQGALGYATSPAAVSGTTEMSLANDGK